MASYAAPTQSPPLFNPTTYASTTSKYLPLTGGTVSGITTFNETLNAGSAGTYSIEYAKGSAAAWDSVSTNAFGGVGYFKGSNTAGNYFIIKGIPASEFSGDWTIEWFARPNLSVNQTAVMLSIYPLYYLEAVVGWFIGSVAFPSFSFRNGSGRIASPPHNTFAFNTWRHFAISYVKSSDEIYVTCGGIGTNGTVINNTINKLGGVAPSDIADMGICIGARYSDFTLSNVVDICHLRISKSARYTSSLSYVTPSSDYIMDSDTILINTLASSDLSSCESRPSASSGYGIILNSTGDTTASKAIVSSLGDLKSTVGHIDAPYGKIKSYRDFTSRGSSWRMGPASLLSSTAISTTDAAGCYLVSSGGWSVVSNTHEIHPTDFLLSTQHRSVVGQFRIFCSDKASSTSKNGIITADYYFQSGTTTGTIFTISTSKTANLSTFSVAATAASSGIYGGITVTTDSGCRISWVFVGGV